MLLDLFAKIKVYCRFMILGTVKLVSITFSAAYNNCIVRELTSKNSVAGTLPLCLGFLTGREVEIVPHTQQFCSGPSCYDLMTVLLFGYCQ